jgi:hypothetical protein
MLACLLPIGLFIWIGGTLAIRLVGQHLLLPDATARTLLLYAVSFAAMAWVVPRLCRLAGVEPGSWPKAATLLILPTLVLDPFSCAFFTSVFPNLDPRAAGVFGGWMLMCCGGGVAGAWLGR